jgi:hypothetical protein
MTTTPPPVDHPDERVSTGDERAVLTAFLDMHRSILRRKVSGLSDVDARRRLVPSATTLAGLLKHVAAVEREWFQHYLAELPDERIDGDWRSGGWSVAAADTMAGLLADYDAACARSREITAGLELSDTAPHDRLGRISLRWVLIHLVEETARHVGHADILREQIDGATGFDG